MRWLTLALAMLASGGCSTMADALGSKEAAAGCQVADVASTHYALHHNPAASEQNPIPVPALDVIKLALASFIMWGISDKDWNDSWVGVRIFVTAIGCGAAVSNVRVARGIQ